MLDKEKSLSNPIIKNNNPIIKTDKFFHNIIRYDSSTPKLPTIKKMFPEISKTPINDKNETTSTSKIIKNKLNHKILFSPKVKDYNSFRNLKIKKLNFSRLFKSSSAESIIPKKMPNIRAFHQNIMSNNKISCDKAMNEEYLKYENQYKNNYDLDEMLLASNDKNRKIKTGIYGPNDNIVSVIRAKMERLKYDNEYRGVEPELKELIKDEIMDAQVKLKRKPEELNRKKFQIRPLYLRKLDQYRYLSKMNIIREINQMSNTPVIVKDGQVMLKLINDAFNNFKIKK